MEPNALIAEVARLVDVDAEVERLRAEHALALAVADEAVQARKAAEAEAAEELQRRLAEANARFQDVAREREVVDGKLREVTATHRRKLKALEVEFTDRTAVSNDQSYQAGYNEAQAEIGAARDALARAEADNTALSVEVETQKQAAAEAVAELGALRAEHDTLLAALKARPTEED